MTPNVLRLVSRGKDYPGALLPHLPKQWLRAPLRVEITCAADDDTQASLADVSQFSLIIREINADRQPLDTPESIIWFDTTAPVTANLGKTRGPHGVFEMSVADAANITEAKEYWIAVHADTGSGLILRAAGYLTFADDGMPTEPPEPTPPGTVYMTQGQADARYLRLTGGTVTGTVVFTGATPFTVVNDGFPTTFGFEGNIAPRTLLFPDDSGTLATQEWVQANGVGATNLAIGTPANVDTVTITSDTGTDAVIPAATTTAAGVMTASQVSTLASRAPTNSPSFTGTASFAGSVSFTGAAVFEPSGSLTFVDNTDTYTAAFAVGGLTASRTYTLPDGTGNFALTGITEGVPDKLGTSAKCGVASASKGAVVYITGATGSNPIFGLADADTEATSSKTYGFIDRACVLNDQAIIITNGILGGLSIALPNVLEGSSLWLSSTAGAFVFGSPPAKPAHSVYLGIATKVVNPGTPSAVIQTIEVKIQNGYEIGELHDVADNTATTIGFLVKNTGTSDGFWRTRTTSEARGDLGLGSIATQAADNVSITGGTISGLTSISAVTGTLTGSTASNGTTSGALVVTGGVGIGGALYAGADSFINDIRVGRGGGNIATNLAIGQNALSAASFSVNCIAIGSQAMQNATARATGLAISSAGSGGVIGPTTYNGVQLTYVSGATATTYPTANITVTSGAVTAITLVSGGTGFTGTGTVLTAASGSIGGVTGFQASVSALSSHEGNVAIGGLTGTSASVGNSCTFIGFQAGRNSTGNQNTYIGSTCGSGASSSGANVFIGALAGTALTSGGSNVIIGTSAVNTATGCTNSVIIGQTAQPGASGQTNQIVIGRASTGDGSDTTVIGNTSTVSTRVAGTSTSVFIVSGNELRIDNASSPTTTAAGFIGAIRRDVDYLYLCASISTTGATINNAGTAGTNGTYRNIQLARVSGGTATAYPVVDVVISGGVVTSVTVVGGTTFSSAGNPIVMAPVSSALVGNITNFQYTLSTLTTEWKRTKVRVDDIVPLTEGGTGASTAAGARANLGFEGSGSIVTDATTARTLAIADAAKYHRFTSSSAITITIPTNATAAIPIGSEYFIRRAGTGAISFSNAGVTVNNSDIANLATGKVCCLKKIATDEWDYI